jgi:hypothetical protein
MAEKRENSVLFSLRELRTIEEERVQEEADAVREAEEARLRAQMEAEQAARSAEEAKRRAAEEAERSAREDAERQAREEQLRLEEAERRARVEAQAQLERDRLAREMEIRAVEAKNKKPTWLIALAAFLVLSVAGLGYWGYTVMEEKEQQEKLAAAYKEKVEKYQGDIDSLVNDIKASADQIAAAKSEEERLAAQAEMARKEKALKEKRAALAALQKEGKKKRGNGSSKPKKPKGPKCDPNDPLCGL